MTALKQKTSPEQRKVKQALKTIKFWYKVLLETDYMNDLDNRIEYQSAIKTIAEHKKKMKGI
jgi:hypothetical protein